MKDRSTGKSRGFGFVTFYRAGDAACAANQEHVVDGRRCEVSHTFNNSQWLQRKRFQERLGSCQSSSKQAPLVS